MVSCWRAREPALTPTLGRDFRDRRVFVGAELLWNVLEAISRDVAASKSDAVQKRRPSSDKFFAAIQTE